MRARVVVESMWGNTEQLARAVAEGMGPSVQVEVVPVDTAGEDAGQETDLLVVGGPTHAFGMSRQGTREDAVHRGAAAEHGVSVGTRELLDRLHPAAGGTASAAFDTRVRKRGIPGSAARGITKRLRGLGYRELSGPTTFWVADMDGPLLDGEVDRAREWGAALARQLTG